MRTSEQVTDLFAALAAAQGEIEPALKDAANPHFKSKYSDFSTVREVSRQVLAKHGLAILQPIVSDIEKSLVGVTTIITHKSGQFFENDTCWVKAARGVGPQDLGSCATYLRRYNYMAILGMSSTEDDDDGNKGQGLDQKKQQEPEKKYKVDRLQHNQNLITEFAKININQSGLEERFGPIADWDDETYAAARQWYRMLKERMAYEAKQKLEGKA